MATGIDGGIDGGSANIAAPPPVPVASSAFSDLVAQTDRLVMSHLGAVPVLYQPEVGPAVVITGMSDSPYLLVKGDPEAGVEVLAPLVFFRLEDLPADPEFDDPVLTILSVAYRVIERRPDGMGGIVLVIRKVT